MSAGRWLLLGAIAAGVAWLAYGQPWASETTTAAGLPTVSRDLTGADLRPLGATLPPVALVGLLAAWGARAVLRRGLAGLVGLAAVGLIAEVVTGMGQSAAASEGGEVTRELTAWAWLALIFAVVLTTASAAVTLTRPSAAFSGRTPAEPDRRSQMWDALDAGRDPTVPTVSPVGEPPDPA